MAILVAQESGSKLQDIGTKMHYFQASFVSNESVVISTARKKILHLSYTGTRIPRWDVLHENVIK